MNTNIFKYTGAGIAAMGAVILPLTFLIPPTAQLVSEPQTLASQDQASICGDGKITGNEQCDDANALIGDGCTGCRVEFGYSCVGAPSECTLVIPPGCGNGKLEETEACDDNNTADGDGCNRACMIEPGFDCQGTPSMCTKTATCGNGTIDNGEQCDDGNIASGDGCSETCETESGFVCTGQPSTCEAGSSSSDSSDSSEPSSDAASFETASSEANSSVSETASAAGTASSTSSFRFRARDRASIPNYAAMEAQNASVSPDEKLHCGDGLMKDAEQCDDGNNLNGDGCSATCTIEHGYVCHGIPSNCYIACGDGIVAGFETCDDGGNNDGDGCSSTCHIENEYQCSGEPSTCTKVGN